MSGNTRSERCHRPVSRCQVTSEIAGRRIAPFSNLPRSSSRQTMKVFFAAAVAATALAAAYAADFCDQWGTATTDDYIIYSNLWGESYATSGSQCTGLDSSSGSTVA
ncbi:unnamed protein product [Phytophthora lilii]|uniref:Unnamed protein product n=1 Tax=Phytophthora lilii TaxID=2077276 RepID=A0A9W6TKQ4_9STRA|nr:unnamed protein product [Phytophthora lilii]